MIRISSENSNAADNVSVFKRCNRLPISIWFFGIQDEAHLMQCRKHALSPSALATRIASSTAFRNQFPGYR